MSVDLVVAKKMVKLSQSAVDRGLQFDLTFTGLKNVMTAKKCFFSGVTLNDNTRSIDRVDNSKGYVTGNVVACHQLINSRKNSLTIQEIEILYKGVKRHSKRIKRVAK